MEISDELLQEFKDRMHITHDIEDENLKRILSFSVVDLIAKCGPFDISIHEKAKELVFERTRYSYNDALEFFDTNFQSMVTSLGLTLGLEEIILDETI